MKHAFLIIAHDNIELLKRLIGTLDHPDSNIYIHIDKKTRFTDLDILQLESTIKYGTLTIIPRKKITWGGYSLIDCELRLLRIAINDKNSFYHFMSGHDYLLVGIDDFLEYFSQSTGVEHIVFSNKQYILQRNQRYSKFWFFQELVGRNDRNPLHWIDVCLCCLQNILGIDRALHSGLQYEMGSQWCDLTDAFAKYLLDKEPLIRSLFKYTRCCDEVFIQTMFVNSSGFTNHKGIHECIPSEQSLRAIDWNRGKPYVFSDYDYAELMESGKLICRKVDTDTEAHKKLLDLIDKRMPISHPVEKEKCVRCGKETECDINAPVDIRKWYVEGSGQLCQDCFQYLYPMPTALESNHHSEQGENDDPSEEV